MMQELFDDNDNVYQIYDEKYQSNEYFNAYIKYLNYAIKIDLDKSKNPFLDIYNNFIKNSNDAELKNISDHDLKILAYILDICYSYYISKENYALYDLNHFNNIGENKFLKYIFKYGLLYQVYNMLYGFVNDIGCCLIEFLYNMTNCCNTTTLLLDDFILFFYEFKYVQSCINLYNIEIFNDMCIMDYKAIDILSVKIIKGYNWFIEQLNDILKDYIQWDEFLKNNLNFFNLQIQYINKALNQNLNYENLENR
jgi:hypothetical protein